MCKKGKLSDFLQNILIICFFVILLSQVISFLVGSGLLWSLTKNVFSKNEENILQAKLFEEYYNFPVDYVIVGDQQFVDDLMPFLPSNSRNIIIKLPEMNLKDALITLKYLNPKKVNTIAIQNMPIFWTRVKSGYQETDLYDSFVNHQYKYWPINDVRLFFKTIRKLSNSLQNTTIKTRRTASAFGAEFEFPPKYVKYYVRDIKNKFKENDWKKIFWIYFENYEYPQNTSGDVKENFGKLLNDRYVDGLGVFIKNVEIGKLIRTDILQ